MLHSHRNRSRSRSRSRSPNRSIQAENGEASIETSLSRARSRLLQTRSLGENRPNQETTIRSRGVYRNYQVSTVPENVANIRTDQSEGNRVTILCNYVRIQPMKDSLMYQYRVDFVPNIEAESLRRSLFRSHGYPLFTEKVIFDGNSDARSISKLEEMVEKIVDNPYEEGAKITIKIKRVGTVSNQYEQVRIYNMFIKKFLRRLGYYLVSTGAYVHPDLATPIGSDKSLLAVRGFKTAVNVYDNNTTLINFEHIHKLQQKNNVLDYMVYIKNNYDDFLEVIKNNLRGKLVITNYNKTIYRIEEVDFTKNPTLKFHNDRLDKDEEYRDYYLRQYSLRTTDMKQPLLLAIPSNKRKRGNGDQVDKDIYLIPEFCNITGLTDEQRSDNRLKMDLIRASQISPATRVEQLKKFLQQLHSNRDIVESLRTWGYTYDTEPLSLSGRVLATEKIGIGRSAKQGSSGWPTVNPRDAGFDSLIMREKSAVAPTIPKLKIIIGQRDFKNQQTVLSRIKSGFDKVGLIVSGQPEIIRLEGIDSAQNYAQNLKRLDVDTTAAIVILPNQNKERYDAIKKAATVDKGIITQVVTSKLILDERKANGAAVKIGVQVCAKLGGEPWYINLPLQACMICGYDTYRDTANRGRSFGAFIASMNAKYSKWYSKADAHNHADELSTHMAENLRLSLNNWKKLNGKFPDRVMVYRDGVGDGQLAHVFETEIKELQKAIKQLSPSSRLSVIIVNKRIGARFFLKNNQSFDNCVPGTVIDDVVTRKERYDFYLISQSTRQGTITPTYYNIIHDESGLDPGKHQALAYKLCFAYYNWTGTVKVPAPCQYAHKLAQLCGDHLHYVPNIVLDDRLHFL